MRTEIQRMGVLHVDHRASPGLSPEDAIEAGYDPDHVAEGKELELHTITCKHCGGAFIRNPDRARERGRCHRCHWYLCDGCAAVYRATGQCTPWNAQADFHLGGERSSKLWIPRGIEDQSNHTLILTGAGRNE